MGVPVLLAHPFRPFFLLAGIYAIVVVLGWIAFLFGGWPIPLGWSPLQWHSHEMLYGFVAAAIAGFVLTAMTNWTGAHPLQGLGLLSLLLLWLAGRLAMWFAGWLPGWLVAVVDLAFLPVLAIYMAHVLISHQNRRNLVLVAVLTLLFIGNLYMQIGFATGKTGLLQTGQLLGLDLVTVLIVVIAGRIIPAFSSNWLRSNGHNPEAVKTFRWLEFASLGSVVLLLLVDWLPLPIQAASAAALLAGAANGVRLAGWAGWKTAREPLLWILHLAYLWVVVALLLRGASAFTDTIAPTVWQHALGVGGIGTLILGVMTRVAVGHTGRPLQLQRFAVFAYIAITGAAVLRLLAAAGLLDYRLGVSLSALSWVVAFSLFVLLYAPVLAAPRPDGRPG
ncbi:NnrS family protein [Kineobactrum salinum]|uniref:NnrS family protein n=2 Tax=Kineobactrum salinum TaxID=2708301 RepID=A0A6C0U6Y8_9GAMM|nr:NnrS family protein [Kineobactrum salinum]